MKITQPSRIIDNTKKVLEDLYQLIRGNITFGTGPINNVNSNDESKNIAGAWAAATTPGVVNTEFVVTHNIGRVPTGFFVVHKSGACDVYDSGTAWTATQIFLKATVININLTIFILG
jgi:hypothetical protein